MLKGLTEETRFCFEVENGENKTLLIYKGDKVVVILTFARESDLSAENILNIEEFFEDLIGPVTRFEYL